MKIIFLNGPPGSGKDFAARVMYAHYPKTVCHKFSAELKERCHAAYRLMEHGKPRRYNWYEDRKDIPLEDFSGLSPRQAYIAFSENWLKPTHGDAILGEWLANELWDHRTNVISDSGFAAEAVEVIRKWPDTQCLLIRIHRECCDFSNDSRSYINIPGVVSVDVDNHGDESFAETIRGLM